MAFAPRFVRQRGRLDQKITIMRRAGGTNAMNEPVNEWEPLFTTRAQAYPAPGFERRVGDQNVATTPYSFEVRDEARTRGILPSDRVRWDSNNNQMFNIVAPVEQPERGRNLRITAAADTGG
jgi:head-tail adaptor